MRRIAMVAISAFMVSIGVDQPAGAADMPVKVIAPAQVVAASWAGFYIGANIGYGRGSFRHRDVTEFDSSGVVFSYPNFNVTDSGWLGGIQLGYNWQSGQLVYGLEGDLQLGGIEGTTTFPTSIFGLFAPSVFNTVVDSELRYFGTVRGRIGYAISPATTWNPLVYVTAGYAYGSIRSNLAFPTAATGVITPGFSVSDTKLHHGWTLGGGIEAKVSKLVSVKLEYLYVNLLSATHSRIIASDLYTWRESLSMHVVRLGLNVALPIAR